MNKEVDKKAEEIEHFSYRYLEKEEIAIVVGVPLDQLNDPDDPYGIAFLKGRLKRKAEFHDSVIRLSSQLSSPAMAIEQKIAEQTYINDLRKR